MSQDKSIEFKTILIPYFPSVLIDVILSYVPKYNLQFIKPDDGMIENSFKIMIRDLSNKHKLPKEILEIYLSANIDIIDENTFLLRSYGEKFIIFDIKTLQILENFYCKKNMNYYCTCDRKYIIFIHRSIIKIFNIVNIKNLFESDSSTYTIESAYNPSREIFIIDDIIYITAIYQPIISKYKLSGEHIDNILFQDKMRTPWQKSVLTVTNDEIVIIIHDKIIFCDLNGVEQKKSTINYVTRRAPGVTSKNIYIYLDNDVIHKYQRNL